MTDIMTCNKLIRVRCHTCRQLLHKLMMIALMMIVGGGDAWADGYEGIWYIANDNTSKGHPGKVYSSATDAEKWYLVPAADPQQTPSCIDAYYSPNHATENGDPNKPFLSTYQTSKDLNSIWIVKESEESGFYFVIHALTGKYVIYEPPLPNDNAKRKSMHLQTIDNGDYDPTNTLTNAKFKFGINSSNDSPTGNINFYPKSRTGWYWNPAGQNNTDYHGQSSKEGTDLYRNGLVGVYNNAETNSIWHFEDASSATTLTPVISDMNESTITFTITSPAAAFSTIRYTTDGSTTPNATTGTTATSGNDISITARWNVQAVGVFGSFITPVAGPKLFSCATPVFSFNDATSLLSLSCATANTTIYYTTDGSTPTTESTEYSAPFAVAGNITVKAIASHPNLGLSEVATFSISQVATPTIQNNGSNAISITSATEGATIYYTTDGSTPTTGSTEYTTPLRENVSGVTIKAIAVKANMITSAVGSGAVTLQCEEPVIDRVNATSFRVTCPFPASGVTIYYTTDGSTPTTSSSSTTSGGTVSCALPATVKAFAVATNYNNSAVASEYITDAMGGDGSAGDPFIISCRSDVSDFISQANTLAGASKHYKVTATGTLNFSGVNITQEFSGTFDGGTCILTGLTNPLFNTVNGGVVKNVTLKDVSISSSAANVGAIAGVAKGYSRIYNCGILPNSADFPNGTHPSVTTSGATAGGIVGSLQDDSRVINCFSYADVSASTTAAGIVGDNTYASTAAETDGKYADLRTAVVNCMFYGNILGGTNQHGVYGGTLITNADDTGISSYNYYRSGSSFNTTDGEPTAYNCSFPAEERYLTQVEFHRSLLNSNRELCGWWVGSDVAPSTLTTAEVQAIPKNASLMYKWVVDPNLAPYPILKPFGKYQSIINGNTGTPWFDRETANPYEGKKLGTLSVTVQSGDHSDAANKILNIPITDMDTLNYDYGYRKIQLPYFNTVFGNPDGADWTEKYAGNYTNYVVTGWKVTAVNEAGKNSFKAAWEDGYNFADRDCTDKDLFSTSRRVFAQGGYYYVPNDVTSITIEAYWGNAIYVRNADASYDRVNVAQGPESPNKFYGNGSHFAPAGTRGNNVNGATIQSTTKLSDALTNTTIDEKKTVYDYALVLVGNVQEAVGKNDFKHPNEATRGFTMMSVDLDFDEEPDYCLEWQLGQGMGRQVIAPIRFDFLPVVELGIAGKLHNSTSFYSLGCYRSKGHFEVTETSFIRFGQFEFELGSKDKGRDEGPIILNGGIYDQYCRGRNGEEDQNINYVILGGHVVMPSFTPGAHVNDAALYQTRHCAVNVLGGNFNSFYLTGGYNEAIVPYEDNPHCYIDGGRFGTIAAAYKEGIWGNVTWRINHALIDEFYGGGVMSEKEGSTYKIVKGSIDVVIDSCIVGKYCGGPKFGDMEPNQTVTTSATGTIFGEFYGAGNGGTNYVQYATTDDANHGPQSASTWASTVSGKYTPKAYKSTALGYEADYDIEVINTSTGDLTGRVVNRSYYYSAQFATTNTGNVTSTLTDCTVKKNFYGGGFLGGVNGNVTSTLTNTHVLGSAFGAGYSASAGTVTIHNRDKTPPIANTKTGLIKPQSGGTSTTYYWTHEPSVGGETLSTGSPTATEGGKNYFYTEVPLNNLGTVTGNVSLAINGTSEINGDVFGGGDESHVLGNSTVTMTNGKVLGSVYGGGNVGSVGTFDNLETAMPTACSAGGTCTVTITGGEVGPSGMRMKGTASGTPDDHGHVFGAGKGYVADPEVDTQVEYSSFANTTSVTIGGTGTNAAYIRGSVYGGSENGHVLSDTNVLIEGDCQIGEGEGHPTRYTAENWEDADPSDFASCAHWDFGKDTNLDGIKDEFAPYDPYANKTGDLGKYANGSTTAGGRFEGTDGHTFYGNVFGGGSGYYPYAPGKWLISAGEVRGNTHVTITGGHILTNVYGGNEMTNVKGDCTIEMSGGTLGVPRTWTETVNHPVICYLFGGGKGDQRVFFNKDTNVRDATMTISGTARIFGSVFGGGEDGHVMRNATLTISGGTIGTFGTTYVDGNVFGGGRGFGGDAYTAGNVAGTVNLNITAGTILGSVYGGGRLASVGYGLYDEGVPGYGEMRDNDKMDDGSDGSLYFTGGRGNVTISISGGIIGNDYEYVYPTNEQKTTGSLRKTKYDDSDNRLLHTRGGNVFAGGMGRSKQLDETTEISAIDWRKLGSVKSTKITVSGTAWIKSNIYGGGELGAVQGTHTSEGGKTVGTEVIINGGTIGTNIPAGGGGEKEYYFGSVFGGGYGTEDYATFTTTDVNNLAALVHSNTSVKMTDGIVRGSVYGGGEVACVGGNTDVSVSSGEIGYNEVYAAGSANPGYVKFGSWRMGNVYGGGRGSKNTIIAGLVKGNTNVAISGDAAIYHNVYGGGADGSVGTFHLADDNSESDYYHNKFEVQVNTPVCWTENTGKCTLTLSGGTIGISGRDNGMVNASSRGDVAKPTGSPAVDINDMLAWTYETDVTVSGTAHIKGSLYGGGENGHNAGNAKVTLNGGKIGIIDDEDPWYDFASAALMRKYNKYRGNVYGSGCGTDTYTGDDSQEHHNPMAGIVKGNTEVTVNDGTVMHHVFGGGSMGPVGGNVVVNMNGGIVKQDIYGGCANTGSNTNNKTWDVEAQDFAAGWADGKTSATNTTTVNLHGGKVGGTVFGGGLGSKTSVLDPDDDNVPAYVYGDVLVELNNPATKPASGPGSTNECQVLKIHGCNNYNGTPKGKAKVHVYKTVAYGDGIHTKALEKSITNTTTYDVEAVYGGGNEAGYDPESSSDKSEVIIDGCDATSIKYVYGGGNAAPSTGTHVQVNSCYEIYNVFGGGNGKDAMDDGSDNPGADVGYRSAGVSYGTGDAVVDAYGGTMHYIFGGSNTKGNVRNSALVNLDEDEEGGCDLCVDEVYGAGNEADQDGTSNINLGCLSYLKELYGGAKNADIDNDIVLTVQSGRFDRVFGGNNLGGTISGTITVNVEETGCHPIVIGQLYGGGNQAAYTAPWKDDLDHSKGRKNGPTINAKSFTSIGEVYGGGYGASATVTGDTYVYIDECVGDNNDKEMKAAPADDESQYTGVPLVINEGALDEVTVNMPLHKSGKIGAIGNVYGGGNAADVNGNTNVRIGTQTSVTYVTGDKGAHAVTGVDIRGNVFGGGNAADVTGNTNVKIGKKNE